MVHIGNDWDEILKDEWQKPYYLGLREFLKKEYSTGIVYPDMNDIFNALKLTPFSSVRAVIIGQDPYHGEGQAHGLCLSVRKGIEPPPSLKNIFKELESDIGMQPPKSGELTKWAERGVLMLNTVLTVKAHQANSHRGKGWEILTDRIILELNKREEPIVFLLWGNPARKKGELITNPIHKKLETVHPSPLSAYNGFFGCRHFSKANEYLSSFGLNSVEWDLNK